MQAYAFYQLPTFIPDRNAGWETRGLQAFTPTMETHNMDPI